MKIKMNAQTIMTIMKMRQENMIKNDCPYFSDCCVVCCVEEGCKIKHFDCTSLSGQKRREEERKGNVYFDENAGQWFPVGK